ncbi:MAG: hypothetical protein KIT83_21420 [Bryobacterales bacterium]|nr:hypothetical protein [Bryobacterales bacterium]
MGLNDARNETRWAIAEGEDEPVVVRHATEWYRLLKVWESQETFQRAFEDGRMTGRMAPLVADARDERIDGKTGTMKFQVADARGQKKPMNFNPFIKGLSASLDPRNFLAKKKNELGIHEYSAVLLKPAVPISKQLFAKPGSYPVFMPIPLEEDLQLFDMLSTIAKRSRGGPLYPWFVEMRANVTRITYGSATDMKVGFLGVDKGDGKSHFRYGLGTITGAVIDESTLRIRRHDALHYKTEILQRPGQSSNNEVTIKYRSHAGGFPWVGNPGPHGAHAGFPPVKADEFVLATHESRPKGILTDNGAFRPF